MIVNQDVDLKVLDGREYHWQKAEGAAQKDLIYEKLKGDLDADHLEGAVVTNIARILMKYVPDVDSRTCPAIILILSPLGTQTWIEEQDSEERGGSSVSGYAIDWYGLRNIKQNQLGVSLFLDLIRP